MAQLLPRWRLDGDRLAVHHGKRRTLRPSRRRSPLRSIGIATQVPRSGPQTPRPDALVWIGNRDLLFLPLRVIPQKLFDQHPSAIAVAHALARESGMRDASRGYSVALGQFPAHRRLPIILILPKPREHQQMRRCNLQICPAHNRATCIRSAGTLYAHAPFATRTQVGLHLRRTEPALRCPPLQQILRASQRAEDPVGRSVDIDLLHDGLDGSLRVRGMDSIGGSVENVHLFSSTYFLSRLSDALQKAS